MLSILIPTYNYDVFPLVKELHEQCLVTKIEFEILCLDDCSSQFLEENGPINDFDNCKFEILKENIGRSKIRNLLAQKAIYDTLLFLDADVFPKNKNFIQTYIDYISPEENIVYGGIKYQEEKPPKKQLLRWVYGNSREALSVENRNKNIYLSFLTLSFLIKKSIFEKVCFNESIPNLRHEDTLFSFDLKNKNIPIIHIENPVYHYGLDHFNKAIQKEKESLSALKFLIDNDLLTIDYVRISKLISQIKKLHLISLVAFFYRKIRIRILKNLESNTPSLFLFDIYRVGYLCQLENDYKTQPTLF